MHPGGKYATIKAEESGGWGKNVPITKKFRAK
jgi:hypothetical protein